ncbi:MAG: TIGR02117 family protein [Sphingomonas sp.]
MARNGGTIWRQAAIAVLSLGVSLTGGAILAIAIGGAIPVNADWRQASAGVRIYVADNGVHTDLVLPMRAEGVDWGELLAPGDLADPAAAAQSHVSFGWGNRDFYLNTPTWSRLDPLRAVGALAGVGPTVVHVEYSPEPAPAPDVRAVVLRPDEYRRLAAFVRATFARRADGRAASVHGYGAGDAFYEARGRYSALNTCNQWTGSALRIAGVRIGAWTPLTFSVMRWL